MATGHVSEYVSFVHRQLHTWKKKNFRVLSAGVCQYLAESNKRIVSKTTPL